MRFLEAEVACLVADGYIDLSSSVCLPGGNDKAKSSYATAEYSTYLGGVARWSRGFPCSAPGRYTYLPRSGHR
jgi:hypothetical protein